ncbi:MAG: sigma-54-dependent Fis family transcriptional regulator [Candidatus Aminicenantes bacterium]|nr:sigma-54-dependent Fis family transcriptional regulator [Candidatus Aminicenantes bacterium]
MIEAAYPEYPVLIVDDEENALESFEITLNSARIDNIILCSDSREVMPLLKKQKVELILLDLTMPHIPGEELLPRIIQYHPDIPVIIITGNIEVETAVKCMQLGAFDYMVKPVEEKRLISGVKRGIERNRLQRENVILRQQLLDGHLAHPEAFENIITGSPAVISIFRYVEVIAKSPEPVLLTGETGVGKELIARAIHKAGGRKGAFVPVNAAGVDDTIFSDTLFGHRKGAFTDAYNERSGLIEQAAEGTLFLDEIGDLSLPSQVKLLRLLQEREYFPIGSDIARQTDAHIIAATNQELETLLKEGKFRKDLYYRLTVHTIHIPPLRERTDDLLPLINHFLKEATKSSGKKNPTPPNELFLLLSHYPFPGNIRELRSMIFNAVSSHISGMLSMESFKKAIGFKKKKLLHRSTPLTLHFPQPLPTVKEVESLLIREALKLADGNQSIAAEMLGITRQTLNRKLKLMALQPGNRLQITRYKTNCRGDA